MIQTHKRLCHSQSTSSAIGQPVSIAKPDKSPQKQTVEVQVPARAKKCLDSPFSAERPSRESGMEAQRQALKDRLASLRDSNAGTFGHPTVPPQSEAPNATELAMKMLNENSVRLSSLLHVSIIADVPSIFCRIFEKHSQPEMAVSCAQYQCMQRQTFTKSSPRLQLT